MSEFRVQYSISGQYLLLEGYENRFLLPLPVAVTTEFSPPQPDERGNLVQQKQIVFTSGGKSVSQPYEDINVEAVIKDLLWASFGFHSPTRKASLPNEPAPESETQDLPA